MVLGEAGSVLLKLRERGVGGWPATSDSSSSGEYWEEGEPSDLSEGELKEPKEGTQEWRRGWGLRLLGSSPLVLNEARMTGSVEAFESTLPILPSRRRR
jgi:hypothetical protein